jgi:hypothetical protein
MPKCIQNANETNIMRFDPSTSMDIIRFDASIKFQTGIK